MNKYFITLFINDHFYQYRLDDMILNSSNGYINEDFGIGAKKLYFPVQIQSDSYVIHNKTTKWCIKHDGEIVKEPCELRHGNYYVIDSDDISFAALVVEYQSLTLSSQAYSLNKKTVFIGRSNDMNIVLDLNGNISRKTAAIHTDGNGTHTLEDLSGKTGIYVNGEKTTSCVLSSGDEIFIMGTTMVYFNGMIIIPANIKTTNLDKCTEFDILPPMDAEDAHAYARTPRILKSQETGKVIIDAPIAPQKSKEIPFILTAGPSMTMSLAMLASLGVTISNAVNGGEIGSLITSGVMCVSMLAGALLWPNLLRKYTKRQEEANEKYRQEKYAAYLTSKEREIHSKYERNARVLNETLMPAPDALISFAVEQNRRLWERVPADDDFLSVRLGIGEQEFAVDIQAPNKGFVLEDDILVDNAISLANKYRMLGNVPIQISLIDNRVIGVVGDLISVANTMLTNLVALYAHDEVKIALIYNPKKCKDLKWAMDLPHIWSNDRRQRYVATSKAEVQVLLSQIDEFITNREAVLAKDDNRIPHFVFLVMDESLVEDVPFRKHMVDAENKVGVSTVFFGKRFNSIPKECVAIIQKDKDVCGIYIKNENNNQFVKFDADVVSPAQLRQFADAINKIKVKNDKGVASVPDRVTFLDMYKVGNIDGLEILNHWGTNTSEKSLAAPIGVKAGGEAFSLDIHEKHHGCHGLVAGTTGSGKSEFLQAYILSMMINYSPNEVAFVLVDFKGGDMARPFLKSPHLAATISNLSGNTLHRALVSLEAEVKSRQKLFNVSAETLGVDKIDINSYHRYFKDKKLNTPLPHLVIVIDEFAQLKTQHPEFMAKLIDIAQVGRSLGIHLILATQRPSGVVDPQIWSNSRFKVCLKVLDKQDSMDMINRPEAALIKQPGRAYVQVGYDEIFEQVQSGYSGADYVPQDDYIDEESITVRLVNCSAEQLRKAKKTTGNKKNDRTQLEEIVSVLANAGSMQGIKVKQLWLPPLAESLRLETVIDSDLTFNIDNWNRQSSGGIKCGIVDMPDVQKQEPFCIDLVKNGHLAIYGSSGVGKSTLIQTILFSYAKKYSPDSFNVFALDFDGGSLASIASMPHCAGYASGDDDSQIEAIMNKIQATITKRRELFAQQRCANFESYIMNEGNQLPIIALVLDNYAAFREKMYRSEDQLVQLISAARSCGIYLVVTGSSKGAIYYKVTEQISDRIVLNMNDSGSYRDILNVPIPIEPANVKGRALTVLNKKAVEVQFAVPFDCENESARMSRIQSIYNEMSKCSERPQYDAVSLDDEEDEIAKCDKNHVPVVAAKQTPALESLDSESNACVIGADTKTHRAVGFKLEANTRVFVCDRGNRGAVSAILNRLARNTTKQLYLITSECLDDLDESIEFVDDIDTFISEVATNPYLTDLVVCIDGFCDFFDKISDEALADFERALECGVGYTLLTFDSMQRIQDYRDTGLYVKLIRSNDGAVIGGSVDDVLSSALTTQIYEINKGQREKELSFEQAFVYSKVTCSYVDIEGVK